MRIALAQINPVVGDLPGNSKKIVHFSEMAASQKADLVVFPELSVCGYPPMDLLEHDQFIRASGKWVDWIATRIPKDIGVLVGCPVVNQAAKGKRLRNAAILLENGKRLATVYKTLLPTYDVFDEYRYFERARKREIVEWRDRKLGIHICEDMWNNEDDVEYHLYDENPVDELAAQGADIFVNLSASPYACGKIETRHRLVIENCREHGLPFILVNQTGANTEIIFDGTSMAYHADGTCAAVAPAFEESLTLFDETKKTQVQISARNRIADIHDALVLGIRDYFQKTGFFNKALLGLSGGIDSAVTCALAVEALGPDRVAGATLPSRYSSPGSVTDSKILADNLGIEFLEIAIRPAVSAYAEMLAKPFEGTTPGVAEENIQARTRGVVLMALSNKFNHLLLTTGNKSEMAVGYATLYGDMNGGLAVLADVLKMDVYKLADYINARAGKEVIPANTISKPPSAELRPDQTDQDSLPPYPVLDEILTLYIEDWLEPEKIADQTGYERDLIDAIVRKVDMNEYKRRQAAPGLKVSPKAFGVGRRLPIVMSWDRSQVNP